MAVVSLLEGGSQAGRHHFHDAIAYAYRRRHRLYSYVFPGPRLELLWRDPVRVAGALRLLGRDWEEINGVP